MKNRKDMDRLPPGLIDIRKCFPQFKLLQRKRHESLHNWVNRISTLNRISPRWIFSRKNEKWCCNFYMKKAMIASCSATKKNIAQRTAARVVLENLGVFGGKEERIQRVRGSRRRAEIVAHERCSDEGLKEPIIERAEENVIESGEDALSASFVEENILEIQRKILSNQVVIGESIKQTVGSAVANAINASGEDPRFSYYIDQVVRVENSIIMRQNTILGCVGSFSVSHNAKLCQEFQNCEAQFCTISYQSEVLGSLNKSNFKGISLNTEEQYLMRESKALTRRVSLPVNKRMIREKWCRIIENQSSMLDNLFDIMCTLSGINPDIAVSFKMLNKDNHMCFLDNVTTLYRYKIHFHENEILAIQNDVMHTQLIIVNDQRRIIEKEKEILKAFKSCVFSKDLVHEMSGRMPFLDNELHALQLKTWAGINHLLSKLNQVHLDRINSPRECIDVVSYQGEVLANQKSILANLSRFPSTQKAILENQRLIICTQDEVLNHYVPATNNNEPLKEDNIGFRLLKALGWSGGGLGTNQQGIAEPIRAEGCVGRTGLGYKKVGPVK